MSCFPLVLLRTLPDSLDWSNHKSGSRSKCDPGSYFNRDLDPRFRHPAFVLEERHLREIYLKLREIRDSGHLNRRADGSRPVEMLEVSVNDAGNEKHLRLSVDAASSGDILRAFHRALRSVAED